MCYPCVKSNRQRTLIWVSSDQRIENWNYSGRLKCHTSHLFDWWTTKLFKKWNFLYSCFRRQSSTETFWAFGFKKYNLALKIKWFFSTSNGHWGECWHRKSFTWKIKHRLKIMINLFIWHVFLLLFFNASIQICLYVHCFGVDRRGMRGRYI